MCVGTLVALLSELAAKEARHGRSVVDLHGAGGSGTSGGGGDGVASIATDVEAGQSQGHRGGRRAAIDPCPAERPTPSRERAAVSLEPGRVALADMSRTRVRHRPA